MANLLTRKSKVTLLWNKRMRTIFMLMVMSFIGLTVAAIALLPVAIYSKMVLMGANGGKGVAVADSSGTTTLSFGKQRQEIIRELKGDKDLLMQVATIRKLPRADGVLLQASELAESVQGAELRLIGIEAHFARGLYTLRLSGTAVSRSAVVSVRDIFEESAEFIVTDFPLGNLTPQGDAYNFLIELATEVAPNTK